MMTVPRASLTIMALLVAACGQDGVTRPPAAASSVGFSLAVQISVGSSQHGSGLPSPLAVQLSVRDASGGGVPIVGGDLVVRDSGDASLAQATLSGSGSGHATVELVWPQTALGRRLDIRLDVLDSSGIAHTVERTLTL
jgi:hypothetical protein